jgi:hypothetical protein
MTETLLVDAACAERGCACYDDRDGTTPVEMVPKKEWVGLTLADKEEYLALDFGGNRLDAMDWAARKLKEKNNVAIPNT